MKHTCQYAVHQVPQVVDRGEVTWAQWVALFNWVNWVGLVLFLAPVVVGYCAVHAWLWAHDPVLFYGSLYLQLALLCVAWKQV